MCELTAPHGASADPSGALQMEAQEDLHASGDDASVEEVVAAIEGLLATCSEQHRHLQWLAQDPAGCSRARLKELLVGRGYSVVECTAQGAESSAKAMHSLRHSFLLCMPDGADRHLLSHFCVMLTPWPTLFGCFAFAPRVVVTHAVRCRNTATGRTQHGASRHLTVAAAVQAAVRSPS